MYFVDSVCLAGHLEERGGRDEGVLVLARPQSDRCDLHRAGVEPARGDREPDLRGPERDGRGRLDCDSRHLARGRVDAGGDVDRDDGAAGRVDQLDHPSRVLTGGIVQSDAEERVDEHVGLTEVADTLHERDIASGLAQDPGADLAVAAVVAAAADDGHAPGEPTQHELGDCRPGALHQLGQRALVRLLGAPGLGSGQQRLQPEHSCSGGSVEPTPQAAITTATAAASSREWVIESSISPAPTFAAHCAVRPLRKTPGFGRPRISISFQVK